jgi:hypothetical protein
LDIFIISKPAIIVNKSENIFQDKILFTKGVFYYEKQKSIFYHKMDQLHGHVDGARNCHQLYSPHLDGRIWQHLLV